MSQTRTAHQTGAYSRRLLQHAVLLAVALMLVFGGIVSLVEPASAASYRTTAGVNLREGPGTSFSVVRVIPGGSTVEVTGAAQFGFLPVTYSGSSGYASADYLTSGGETTTPSPETGTQNGPTGTRYADGRLNLRSGPGTSYGVVLVLPDGAAVSLAGETSNGFSKLNSNGRTGWSATQFLSTSGGSSSGGDDDGGSSGNNGSGVAVGDTVTGSATTTASLNVRSGPATSYAVRLTMPRGARVDVMGGAQSGFLPVRYNGTKGWASADYLSTGGGATQPDSAPTPVPSPGGETVGYKVTTAAVNMRSGPSTSNSVLTVLPRAHGLISRAVRRVVSCPRSGRAGRVGSAPSTWQSPARRRLRVLVVAPIRVLSTSFTRRPIAGASPGRICCEWRAASPISTRGR